MVTEFEPRGDQPRAIRELSDGLDRGAQLLLGVTGSGKTFTAANVIEHQRPGAGPRAQQDARGAALQRDAELFPHNAVEYFVSYYDYYQPEAYIPSTDTFIEKDSIINDRDRPHAPLGHALAPVAARRHHRGERVVHLRHRLGRVPTTACWPSSTQGDELPATSCCAARGHAVRAQRRRLPPRHLPRARRRGRGLPRYEESARCASSSSATRSRPSPRSTRCAARCCAELRASHLPGLHYVTPKQQLRRRHRSPSARSCASACSSSNARASCSRSSASSSAPCTTSRCSSRWASARHRELLAAPLRPQGRASRRRRCSTTSRPDYLLLIDESHQTVPQVGAMYRGDRARKETLVEHGFRLPSALDNRPLKFEEFEGSHAAGDLRHRATPGDYELEQESRASSSSRSSAPRA
jgi:excinuclease ABC subunit B